MTQRGQGAGATIRRQALLPRACQGLPGRARPRAAAADLPRPGRALTCRATARSCSANSVFTKSRSDPSPIVQGGHELVLDRRGAQPGRHRDRIIAQHRRSRRRPWDIRRPPCGHRTRPPPRSLCPCGFSPGAGPGRNRPGHSVICCSSLSMAWAHSGIETSPSCEPPIPRACVSSPRAVLIDSSQRAGWFSSCCTPPWLFQDGVQVRAALGSPIERLADTLLGQGEPAGRFAGRFRVHVLARSRTDQPRVVAAISTAAAATATIVRARLFRRANFRSR